MKVLHLINTLSAGGAEIHLLTLCRHLKRQKVDTSVACLREEVKGSRSLRLNFEEEGIPVTNLQANSRYDSLRLGKLTRLLRVERPDILHTHLPRADFGGAFARALNPHLVWLCSVHAIYSDGWAGRWSLPVFDILWRRADVLLCISQAVRHWLIRRGVPPEKTKVIHYGIDTEKFREPRLKIREKWELQHNVVIGSMGRLEPGKGHDLLLRAMPELCKRIQGVYLLIAGHDPWGYGETLLRLINTLKLDQNVRLVGFQEDVVSFLNALDVFAFATTSEGFGQVLIEAMAAGKAVVASKIAPLTEIAVDGGTGLLVEPGNPALFADALHRLLSNPDERLAMGAAGRQRVEKFFTARRMTEETVSLYEELLKCKS